MELPTPHNNLFEFVVSHLPHARSLLVCFLDATAVAELKLETLKLERTSFLDANLSQKYSDALFSVELRQPDDRAEEASEDQMRGERYSGWARRGLVYLLFEHKSSPEPLAVFQMLTYVVRIGERELRSGRAVGPIVPVLMYHGESEWRGPRAMAELVQSPEALAPYQVHFSPVFVDLWRMQDEEIGGEPLLRATLRLLKYSRSVQLVERFADILWEVAAAAIDPLQLDEWLIAIGVYVMSVNGDINAEQYKQTLQSVFPTRFEPGSLADRLLNEGMSKGMAKGMAKGNDIGRIQELQALLGDEVSSEAELKQLTVDALESKLVQLRQRIMRWRA